MKIRLELEGDTNDFTTLEVLAALRRTPPAGPGNSSREPARSAPPAPAAIPAEATKAALAAVETERGGSAPAKRGGPKKSAASVPALEAPAAAGNGFGIEEHFEEKQRPKRRAPEPEPGPEPEPEPELESESDAPEDEDAGASASPTFQDVNEAARRVGTRSPALVLQVLKSCGVQRVDALPPEKYGLFLRLLKEV